MNKSLIIIIVNNFLNKYIEKKTINRRLTLYMQKNNYMEGNWALQPHIIGPIIACYLPNKLEK